MLKYGARRHEIYEHGWTGFILGVMIATSYAMGFYIFFLSSFFRLRVISNPNFSSKPSITESRPHYYIPYDASLVDHSATSDLDLQDSNSN